MSADPRTNPYAPPADPPAAAPQPGAPGPRKRGGCLTALLVLMMVANSLVGLLYLGGGDAIRRAIGAPEWVPTALGLLCLLNLLFAVGTWRFKKWGVYGFVASAGIALVFNLSMGLASPAGVLGGLLGPALLVVLVRPVWRDFE